MGAAGALSCPKCGATADPEATRCTFCNARLATVACPACFAKFFRGFSNCPWCGTEAEREAVATSHHHCPKCPSKSKLVAVRLGETLVEECGHCAGLWLEQATFERIQTSRDEHAVILGMPAPAVAPPAEAVRYFPCPSCGGLMNRVNFARISGVIIDTCKNDGVWFDADELRRIVAFIEAGGMSKARDREMERLHEEQQALKSTMRQLELERAQDAVHYGRGPTPRGIDLGDVVSSVGNLIGRLFG